MAAEISARMRRKEYEKFIGGGDKFRYYMKKFDAMRQKNSKISFNLCAFLFSSFWCFYRQMLGWGVVGMLLNFGAVYLSVAYEFTYVSVAVQLLLCLFFGFFGNYCYMRHIDRLIEESSKLEGAAKEKHYKENAGTNFKILLGMVFVAVLLSFALLAAYGVPGSAA